MCGAGVEILFMKTSTACESCQKWLLLIFSIWSYPQLQTADTDSLSRDAKQSLVMCGDHWTVRLLPSMEAKLAEFEHLYRWVGLSVWRVTLICHEIFLTFSSSWPGSRDPLFLVMESILQFITESVAHLYHHHWKYQHHDRSLLSPLSRQWFRLKHILNSF